MNKKTILLILLAVVTTANMYAQRGKRAIERIDRETQSRVFIPKGTWMVGGTVSYSEHEQDNLNFLVIKDVVGNGYCCRKRLRFRHQSIRRLFFP